MPQERVRRVGVSGARYYGWTRIGYPGSHPPVDSVLMECRAAGAAPKESSAPKLTCVFLFDVHGLIPYFYLSTGPACSMRLTTLGMYMQL